MNFKYKGIYSSDLGITVETRPNRVSPETRMEYSTITGMDGSYTWRVGKKAYDLTMSIIVEGKENLEIVIGWLSGRGEFERSDIPNRFQYVTFRNEIQYQYVFDDIYRASVTFTVDDPFWYVTGDKFTKLTNVGGKFKVSNNGNVHSKPILRITKGTPRILVRINDVTFGYTFPHNDDHVIIDCRKEHSRVGKVRRDRVLDLVGEFPQLEVGENEIILVEGEAGIEIKYQDRWY